MSENNLRLLLFSIVNALAACVPGDTLRAGFKFIADEDSIWRGVVLNQSLMADPEKHKELLARLGQQISKSDLAEEIRNMS